MGDGFGLFPSSAVAFGVTCGTTTTAGYIQHWTIAPPLTMRDEPRKTWVSTTPREDPGRGCSHGTLQIRAARPQLDAVR